MAKKTARIYDINNWFTIPDNPLTQVGVYDYLGSSIGVASEPDRMFKVFRSAEALSDPEFIESLKLLPFIDDHEMLGEGFSDALDYGVGGVIGENVHYRDGVVYGNVKVFSEALASEIADGKVELSLGYRCRYVLTKGTYNGQDYDAIQVALRGNHVALVDNGRMGAEVRVLDSAPKTYTAITLDAKDKRSMSKVINKHRRKRAFQSLKRNMLKAFDEIEKASAEDEEVKATAEDDEKDVTTGEDDDDPELVIEDEDEVKVTAKDKASCDEDDDKATDEEEAEAKAEDEEEAEARVEDDEDDDAVEIRVKSSAKAEDDEDDDRVKAMDAAELRKEVVRLRRAVRSRPTLDSSDVFKEASRRDRLAKRLTPLIGAFDHSAMTAQQVAEYGCKKLGLRARRSQARPVLEGYLAAARTPTPATTAMDSRPATSSKLSQWGAGK